jgi:flagellar motor switch protein FliN/FliY
VVTQSWPTEKSFMANQFDSTQKIGKLSAVRHPQTEQLLDLPLETRLILGECMMNISEVLRLGQGSVIELDSKPKEPLEVWVNDRQIARAQTVVVEEKVGARIVQIESPETRLKSMSRVHHDPSRS